MVKGYILKLLMSLLKIFILKYTFFYKFIQKIYKKRFFPVIFLKKFNSQIITSWIIISYKIIKFTSTFYKICCEKYFIQNILQKNWQQFHINTFS